VVLSRGRSIHVYGTCVPQQVGTCVPQQVGAADIGGVLDSASGSDDDGSQGGAETPSLGDGGGETPVLGDGGAELAADAEDIAAVGAPPPVAVEEPPPPPPPPPPDPPAPAARAVAVGGRGLPDETVFAPSGGCIKYYIQSSSFVAECSRHHGRCRLTRTSNASTCKRAQGRPLGLMAAWLADHMVQNREDHCNTLYVAMAYSHELRLQKRLELVGRARLEAFERPRDASRDEPEEPIAQP